MAEVSSTPTFLCTNPLFFPIWRSCLMSCGITWLWAWAWWYFKQGHARAGCSPGDALCLCSCARTLPCYTAALWLSWTKWAAYPTAKERRWEVSVWYFHTQKSSPKLELQHKISIQTSPAFCFHWLPSPACTHRVPSFPKENSAADKGHLSQQVTYRTRELLCLHPNAMLTNSSYGNLISTLKMALRVLCEVHYMSHKYFPQMFLPSLEKKWKDPKLLKISAFHLFCKGL